MSVEMFAALPKVALHDHLDGGLRPQTIIEISDEIGHELPIDQAPALADWFYDQANSGSLSRYLETFEHTVACMQTAEQLRRVAREWVADQVADGVVAGEARWAPEQHLTRGLSADEAVEAVGEGLREGMAEAEATGHRFIARQLVSALRHNDRALEMAQLALRHRDSDLVSGFDLAGPEAGFPPSNHRAAFEYLRDNDFYYTIHAGEEGALDSMRDAVHLGAMRLGHGVVLADDLTPRPDGWYELGGFASFVRNRRIPLEVCPSSNLQTGVASRMSDHPIGRLVQLDFNVTLSCDNRLMSRTTLSREFALVHEAFEMPLAVLYYLTVNAAQALFVDHEQRQLLTASLAEPWALAADQ